VGFGGGTISPLEIQFIASLSRHGKKYLKNPSKIACQALTVPNNPLTLASPTTSTGKIVGIIVSLHGV
jgi:hypothetical protein